MTEKPTNPEVCRSPYCECPKDKCAEGKVDMRHEGYNYSTPEASTGTGNTPEAMATGGVKFDGDKPRMDLLDAYAIEQLSKVLTFGATKYAAHNWRKGIAKGRLIAAALRHLFAYLRGEDTDPETGLSHAAHAMCCCMFLLGLEHRVDLDDRYKEQA
jgi:hypothetical protein